MTAGQATILVVEDTAESLMMLTDLLSAQGYMVRPADSGELALASVAAKIPDLILLDIRMPGMDGFEVSRRLKALEDTRDIPIIFISALSATEERVEGLRLGAVDFISKPFQKEELLARVATHVELRRLRMRLEQQVAERTAELKVANDRLKFELSERVRAEQALRESEELFRNMADAAPVVIWLRDTEGRLLFFNKYASILTGHAREELLAGRWRESIHPGDQPHRAEILANHLKSRTSYQDEYRLLRTGGPDRWMLETAKPRFLADGAFAGYVGVALDITELKRNLEQLIAEQKLESVGVLAAGVSHRFNNLLGSILGEADLALADLSPDAPARGSVERIYEIATRASEIVFLLMAYAGTGDTGTLVQVHLGRIVEETLQLGKVNLSKKIVFNVDIPAEVPTIRGNPSQLRQVVMSLITNAAESLPAQQGEIALIAYGHEKKAGNPPELPLDLPPGSYVVLEVSDTGCGMTDEERSRVFDPFFSTKFLGRGLGLAAVHGIVRRHGGAISMQSSPGKGSTFRVFLPSDGAPADELSPPRDHASRIGL